MGKRLVINIFGQLYMVGAIHLTSEVMETGVKLYGRPEWHAMVRDIALGLGDARKYAGKIGYALGHDLMPKFAARGIAMNGKDFGFECFHGGGFAPVDAVSSEKPKLDIVGIMNTLSPGDMLGVYWANQPGAVTYRWDDVNDFDQGGIALVHEKFKSLLGAKASLELAVDVTWQEGQGLRTENASGPLTGHAHVFHRVGPKKK